MHILNWIDWKGWVCTLTCKPVQDSWGAQARSSVDQRWPALTNIDQSWIDWRGAQASFNLGFQIERGLHRTKKRSAHPFRDAHARFFRVYTHRPNLEKKSVFAKKRRLKSKKVFWQQTRTRWQIERKFFFLFSLETWKVSLWVVFRAVFFYFWA